jgi:hypothetical protein
MIHEFEITTKHKITNSEIGDLLICAFEGGINYWCGEVGIKYDENNPDMIYGVPEDRQDMVTYASDVIGEGGELIFTDIEGEDGPWVLTYDKFIEGVKKTMDHFRFEGVDELIDNHDAEVADVLVQYALFNEIVYA